MPSLKTIFIGCYYDPTNKVDFDLDNSSNGGDGIDSSSTLSTSSWKHIVLLSVQPH